MKKEKQEKPPKEAKPKPASAIDLFFKLGDWATGGNPKQQANFQYYMIWMLFLAFFFMFGNNLYNFFRTWNPNSLIFAAIGFAIMSLQFFTLKNMYAMRKYQKEKEKNGVVVEVVKDEIENVDDMLDGFKESNNSKGGK